MIYPLKTGPCRPCRKQASLVAGPGSKTALDLTVAAITGHQLFYFVASISGARRMLPGSAQARAAPPGRRAGGRRPRGRVSLAGSRGNAL